MKQGRSNDVAKLFDKRKTVDYLNRILGGEFVGALEGFTRRASHATATHNATMGSQSADVLSTQENMRALSRLVSMAGRGIGNARQAAGAGMEYFASRMDRQRNDKMMELMSRNSTIPHEMEAAIAEIERTMAMQAPAASTAVGDQARRLSPFIAQRQAQQHEQW